MAILLNDNLDIAANKPVDNRYGPYATVAAAISAIPSFKRHIGLTVGIGLTNTVDHWFKAGTGDTDLIEKVPTVNVPVTSVAGKTGAITLVKGDVGLANVDNTSDANKPISTATQTALDAKQATLVSGTTIKTINGNSLLGAGDIVITGGGGSGNTNLSYTASATGGTVLSDTGSDASLPLVDTTNAGLMSPGDKTKLNDIAANANNYTHPNHTGDVTSTGDGATVIANNAVTNAKLAQIAANTIKGRATGTGNVEDLTAAQVRTILNVADGATANVASTVTPQPLGTAAVGTATAYARADHVHALPTASTIGAQPTLVSGTNIKTINGTSLLGGGDISIGSGGTQVNSDWTATTGVAQILNKPTEFNPSSHTHSQDQISSDYYGNGNLYEDIEYIDTVLGQLQIDVSNNRLVTPAIISSNATLTSGRWVHQRVQNLSASSLTITLPTSPTAGDRFIISSTGGVTQVTQPIIIRRRNWTTTGTGDQFTTLATITALNQEYQFTTQASAQQGWYLEIVETHRHALEDLQQSGATTGQVPKWNGTNWVPADDSGGGGSGNTNLSYTASATGGTVLSDTGSDASLPLVDTTNAGLMSPADKAKLTQLDLGHVQFVITGSTPSQILLEVNKVYTIIQQNPGDYNFALPTTAVNGDVVILRPSSNIAGRLSVGTTGGTPPFSALATLTALKETIKVIYQNNYWMVEYFAKEIINLDSISASGATTGQTIRWDGTNWVPSHDEGNSIPNYITANTANFIGSTYTVPAGRHQRIAVTGTLSSNTTTIRIANTNWQRGDLLVLQVNITLTGTARLIVNIAPIGAGSDIVLFDTVAAGPPQTATINKSLLRADATLPPTINRINDTYWEDLGQQIVKSIPLNISGGVPLINSGGFIEPGLIQFDDSGLPTGTAGTNTRPARKDHRHNLEGLTQSGATIGQVIKWNGTSWVPGDDNTAALYPDIEIFGTGDANGVYKAVPKGGGFSSPLSIMYSKVGTNYYLYQDVSNTWLLFNTSSLVTAARKQSDFPWETSYNSTSTVINRLDQIYVSPLSFQITSPITELIDARRLTEISVSNMAGTSNPSIFILPGFTASGTTFNGGAVTGDIVIINHTQSSQNTTMEVKIPTWTGSGYTGTLTTLLTINKTGRWIFRFNGGVWSILAVAQHTHPVGDLTQSGATTGQVIKWNGTSWAPGDDTGGSGGGIAWSTVPNAANAPGTAGQMAYADNYLYICVAPSVWKRTILATW